MYEFTHLLNDARRAKRPIDKEALSWMGSGLFELIDLVAAAENADFVEPANVEAALRGLESLFTLYQSFATNIVGDKT